MHPKNVHHLYPWYQSQTQTMVVEAGKENRLDLVAESPAHIRFVLEDGTFPENLNVMHTGAFAYLGRQDSINTFLNPVFDTERNKQYESVTIKPGEAIPVFPSEMTNYIIATTYDNQFGLVAKITPEMRGREITLTLQPTITVTEKKGAAEDYFTREWQFQYFDSRYYSIRHGLCGGENQNHTFQTDTDGNLTYMVPVYADDYKDIFFYLTPGQGGNGNGGSGGLRSYQSRGRTGESLFYVDPKTRQIQPAAGN